MFKLSKLVGLLAAMLLATMWAMPAQAQATRTWISGTGDDVNPCSRTAPCKTFPGAISKTAAGGEIDTLDPGGFGAVTVTKAITLADESVGEGGILVAGTNGITVNCATDPNCVVVIRGLVLDGGPVGSNSLSGVRFVAGRGLVIENCTIRNFTGGSPNGYGVNFNPAPNSGIPEFLTIDNTTIMTNGAGSGSGATGGGVNVVPTSGTGSVNVSLTHDVITGNAASALNISTSSMTGGSINTTVSETTISSNWTGVTTSGTLPTNVQLIRDDISNNGGFGIITAGSGTSLKIGSSVITGNTTSVLQAAGSLQSYGNNQIDGNGTNTNPATSALH
jgi:hypothetical protein